MAKKIARIFILAAFVAAGYLLGIVGGAVWIITRPHEAVVRSPERGRGLPVGTLEIPDGNPVLRRIAKMMRTVPPFLWCCGWKVWSERECATGTIGAPRISDDGDIVFDLFLDDLSRGIVRLMDESERTSAESKVLDYVHCEIPYDYRGDFPILIDLEWGLPLRVCGRFVWDRAIDHNEFHPVWWMEIQ
ncbi:MAG: hypothetical protein AAB562_03545 [Patescibacteria group bacterium]|mgnify:CR=1 FL=1